MSEQWYRMYLENSRNQIGMIKLNTNENPYPPAPGVQECNAKAWMTESMRLYPDPTCRSAGE